MSSSYQSKLWRPDSSIIIESGVPKLGNLADVCLITFDDRGTISQVFNQTTCVVMEYEYFACNVVGATVPQKEWPEMGVMHVAMVIDSHYGCIFVSYPKPNPYSGWIKEVNDLLAELNDGWTTEDFESVFTLQYLL